VANTEAEAAVLLTMERKTNVKVQIGHVERFNPAFLTLKDMVLSPMFIEGHRLATFDPRGTDVSVILDLMIHDIDIILSIVDSPVKQINASWKLSYYRLKRINQLGFPYTMDTRR